LWYHHAQRRRPDNLLSLWGTPHHSRFLLTSANNKQQYQQQAATTANMKCLLSFVSVLFVMAITMAGSAVVTSHDLSLSVSSESFAGEKF